MPNTDAKTIYKNLLKIYWFLLLGMIVFLVVASLLVSKTGPLGQEDTEYDQVLKLLIVACTFAGIPLAYTIPQRMIKKINGNLALPQKLQQYLSAMIIRFALTQGIAIFATIVFLLTGDTDLMLFIAIIYLFYIINKPNTFKLAQDLGLTQEEKLQLTDD